MSVAIHRCESLEHPGWLALREALWPHCSREEHLREMAAQLAEPERYAHFLASISDHAVGLAEVAIRNDYVNGTATSPVGFLEGIYVIPEARRRGIAKTLVDAVIGWVRDAGCRELASDARLDNSLSLVVHRALGFEQTERVVFFRKTIG
ncbi:MAG TPA: aminoglycoside 6'-N-acetyltransferase [Burkholderiales bacterium]|nr:aminoglycoside 6'-N-acetyltransferase [Burkholderiales bacterium]